MKSFCKINIMLVFGVKYRLGMLDASWRPQLYRVMANVLSEIPGVIPIEIGGMSDHVHVFFSTRGIVGEAEIMRKVKSESSLWINNHRLTPRQFRWQEGGGRFSYSRWDIETVRNYILEQQRHHSKMSFHDEMSQMIARAGIKAAPEDLPADLE